MKEDILTNDRAMLRPQPRAHIINRPYSSRPAPRITTSKPPVQKTSTGVKVAPVSDNKPVANQTVPSIDRARKEQLIRQVSKMAAKQAKKSRQPKKPRVSHIAYTLASIMLLLTGYVTIDTLMTNQQVRGELTASRDENNIDNQTLHQSREGKDESDPEQAVLSAYSVAPDNPRMLHIDKININARVLPMGVNPDNSVQAPVNIFDAGWYNDSAKPGDIGAVFINAHASGPTRQGLFAYLDTLTKGDKLKIEKGDGTFINYRVVYVETVDLKKVDMRKVLLPYGNTLRGLNLMTCSGEWVQDAQTYDKRTVVYTEQID